MLGLPDIPVASTRWVATHRAVQIFSAEHFLRSHHPWTCAGAPIRDPRTGHVIGIVDVSGPASTVHPTTVALVDLLARLAESRLREAHDHTLNRLRVAAEAEPSPALSRVTLDLSDSNEPTLEMAGEFGRWRRGISSRHAEILLVLATCTQGRSAPELAEDPYGDRSRVVTVRAEMSRLRKQFVGLVAGKPYRFGDSVAVDVKYPRDKSALLTASTSPAVRAARATS